MPWPFKPREAIEAITAKLAMKDEQIRVARAARREMALEITLRDDTAAAREMAIALAALEQERAVLVDALSAAEARERQRRDEAATRQAEAERRAIGQHIAALQKHADALLGLEQARLAEFMKMHATAEKLIALLPKDVVRDFCGAFSDAARLRHQLRIEAYRVSRGATPGLAVEHVPALAMVQDRATGFIKPFVERLGLDALKRRLDEGPKPEKPKRHIISPTPVDRAIAAAEAEAAKVGYARDPDSHIPPGRLKSVSIDLRSGGAAAAGE